MKRRIALASSAFGRLKKNIWSKKEISNTLKWRLFQALIVPIAIYASETWTLKTEDNQRLTVFENDCLRAMVGKTRMDKCKMVDIRRRLGENDNIVDKASKTKLVWTCDKKRW